MSMASYQSNDSAMSEASDESEEESCASLSQASDDSPRAADWKRKERKATARVGSWSCLKCPGHIVPEAFDGKGNRIARQLSAVTGLTLHLVEQTLDEVTKDPQWRQHDEISVEDLEAFAKIRKRGLYIFHGCKPMVTSQGEGGHDGEHAIVASFWSGCWYFLKGAGRLVKHHEAASHPQEASNEAHGELTKSLRRAPKADKLCTEEFPHHQELHVVPPGTYWAKSTNGITKGEDEAPETMKGILLRFLRSGRYPLVSWSRFPADFGHSVDRLTQIAYTKTAYDECPEEELGQQIIVKSAAADSQQNRHWGEKLDVPYGGQSVGVFASLVLETLLRRQNRKPLAERVKEQILERQQRKCALCADDLSVVEFDHIVPLSKGGTDGACNLKALCPPATDRSRSKRDPSSQAI